MRTKYIQPPGCRSPSMTVSEAPGRTIGPGLLLDESANNEMLPPGAISSGVTVTFCPSPNIGLRGDTSGAPGLAAVWVGGTTAGAAGATTVDGRGRWSQGGLDLGIRTGSGLWRGCRWCHGRRGRRLRSHGHRWWRGALTQVGAQPLCQQFRFHRDIANAADHCQEKYPEDRASPTGFLAGIQRAPGFRGDRLIKFLFREFQVRFWLASEEEGPIKRTPD